jgi:hypothetical protein
MDTQNAITQAKKAARESDLVTAQKILKKVITQDPNNVSAWLALADIVEKPEIRVKCLEQVLKIDPGNEIARQRLFSSLQTSSELEKLSETIAPVPQTLDDRLQSVAAPSTELDDPWQIEPQSKVTSSAPAAAEPPPKPKRKPPAAKKTPAKSGRWLEISLIAVLVMTAACVLGLVFLIPRNTAVQGGQLAEAASPTSENPMAVIFENIRASNAENVAHYMSTIHSKSPSYQTTKSMTQEAFSLFDLSYKVSGLKIINQTKKEVVVAFTLTTRKIRGPNFRDNRINGEMILRQEAGKWKIYNQVVHDVKYLN